MRFRKTLVAMTAVIATLSGCAATQQTAVPPQALTVSAQKLDQGTSSFDIREIALSGSAILDAVNADAEKHGYVGDWEITFTWCEFFNGNTSAIFWTGESETNGKFVAKIACNPPVGDGQGGPKFIGLRSSTAGTPEHFDYLAQLNSEGKNSTSESPTFRLPATALYRQNSLAITHPGRYTITLSPVHNPKLLYILNIYATSSASWTVTGLRDITTGPWSRNVESLQDIHVEARHFTQMYDVYPD